MAKKRITSVHRGHQPGRSRQRVAERRVHVAKLYLEGKTQQEIADTFGINQSSVCRDLEAIRKMWRESAVADIGERQEIELAKIDHVEEQAWKAWNQSVESNKYAARFMKVILDCVDRRCRILGLYKDNRLLTGEAPMPIQLVEIVKSNTSS